MLWGRLNPRVGESGRRNGIDMSDAMRGGNGTASDMPGSDAEAMPGPLARDK